MEKLKVLGLAVIFCGSVVLAGCNDTGNRQTSGNNERGSTSGAGSGSTPQGPSGPSSPQKNPPSSAR